MISLHNANWLEAGLDVAPDGVNTNVGTGGAALAGAWVDLKNYGRAYGVIIKPAGSAGDDLVITPLQAQAVAGTGSKALAFSRFWLKQAAALSGVGTWTQYDLTTPSSALNLASVVGNQTTVNGTAPVAIANADLATETNQMIAVIEITADMLDEANQFNCVSMTIPAVGVASSLLVTNFWLLYANKYPQQIPLSPLV